MKLDIEWESYHPDGRKRARPPASTVHGWLTKMRGTLFDNEALRRSGIKEMQIAKATRLAVKKRNLTRANSGRPPLRPTAKQPWLRLSFLRQRPTLAPRKSSSTAVVRRKPDASRSKPQHRNSSKSSKKSGSQQSKKRSASHKRTGKPPAKKAKK